MQGLFVKAIKTRENPKKDNASWTIVNVLIPEAQQKTATETEGALVQIMKMNDVALFHLVKDCKFGDKIDLEAVNEWRNGRLVPEFQIVAVGGTSGKA